MRLKKGQIVYIDNQKYTIINMIEFQQDRFKWQEYEIVSSYHTHKWLCVEENEETKQLEYYLYETYQGKEIDKNYKLYEQGIATVIDYFGNTDVDKNETCEYCDFATKDEESIISIEKWEDETQKTIGHYIENNKIKITQETEQNSTIKQSVNNEPRKKNIGFVVLSIMLTIIVIINITNTNNSKSIQKYIEKQTAKYQYVTSVTSNIKNQKAKVYEASFSSIDETVKDIIDGVPQGITQTIDSDPNTQEDGIGLQTNKEYAYIYEENGKIYIQVSSKEYVKNAGSTYHSRHRHYYYNTFGSTKKSTLYSDYANSARQKSINSRISTGGGTSSGK